MEALEYEVKALHVALDQVQATLTSPELARQNLREQLAQRQVRSSPSPGRNTVCICIAHLLLAVEKVTS